MSEKMKAIAITGVKESKVIDIEKPVCNENEVLIQIKASAICTTEQRLFVHEKDFPMPYVGGHEFSGVVAAIGSNVNPNEFKIGTKCTGRIHGRCGTCYHCRRGEFEQCENINNHFLLAGGTEGTGGFAQYIKLDKTAVWLFDDSVSFETAALTEPLACVLNSIHVAAPKMGDDALIIGGGIMGQIHIMLLKLQGIRTILSEPDAKRREFALKHGCDIVIDPTSEDLEKRIKEITKGHGVETVFNTTAISALAQSTMKYVATMGTIVMYSSQHPDKPIEVSAGWLHGTEVKLTGVIHPPVKRFNQAVTMISKGLIDLSDLVSEVYPFDKPDEGFNAALRPDTYRVEFKF